MGFLDRAKEAAQRATSQAREQGQQRLSELQARRVAESLLREVGLASYEEHSGKGSHEAVVRAVARLDEHLSRHPLDLSTAGLRAYVRAAAGADDVSTRTTAPSDTGGTSEGGEQQQQQTGTDAAASSDTDAEQQRTGPDAEASSDTDRRDVEDREPEDPPK